MRHRGALLLGLGLSLGLVTEFEAGAQPAAEAMNEKPSGELVPVKADPGRVDEILREAGVARGSTPSWTEYPIHLIQSTVGEWTRKFLESAEGFGAFLAGLTLLVRVLIVVALICLAIWVVWLGVRFLRPRMGRGRRPGASPSPEPRTGPAPADAAAWRRELETRLAAGDTAGALEAAWWWFAGSVTSERADPTWTSRQLLSRISDPARRRSLRGHLAGLDAMIYGPRRPDTGALWRWVEELEGALA